MAKQKFVDYTPGADTQVIIDQANEIITDYQARGFKLTLRQLYYQFVTRNWLRNKVQEYKRLGDILSKARLGGLIDWAAIEDRLRTLERLATWDTPADIVTACADQFRVDMWADQPRYIEVWIEKDALVGVIEDVCEEWRVPYIACRGNGSQSMLFEAGKRFLGRARDFQQHTLVLHLGDHDPSGIDMTRDNRDRLDMFSAFRGSSLTEVKRLALNYDQVEQYNPPPNPTKDSDSRTAGYRERFGDDCWELDALDPTVISDLVGEAIQAEVNMSKWSAAKAEEQLQRDALGDVAAKWDDVVAWLGDRDQGDGE